MASKKKQQNLSQSAQQRLAKFEAKQTQHADRTARRSKDNKIALIAGVAALSLALISQLGYNAIPKPHKVAPSYSGTAHPHTSTSATPTPSNGPLVPSKTIAQNRTWTGSMMLNDIKLGISLDGKAAPQAVSNFIALSKKGFYKGLSCHRMTNYGIFVLQCGDPKGDGTGGPGYSFGPIENVPTPDAKNSSTVGYQKGTIAMANSGSPYSNGSQFFIVWQQSQLPPNYTVLGTVTSNLSGLQPIIRAGIKTGSSINI